MAQTHSHHSHCSLPARSYRASSSAGVPKTIEAISLPVEDDMEQMRMNLRDIIGRARYCSLTVASRVLYLQTVCSWCISAPPRHRHLLSPGVIRLCAHSVPRHGIRP